MLGTDIKGEFALYETSKYTVDEILDIHNSEASTFNPYTRYDISKWNVYCAPHETDYRFLDDMDYQDEGLTYDDIKNSIVEIYALKL